MAATGDAQLFEESFTVTDYDQSKYDRVARISGHSHDGFSSFVLDINTEIWPINHGDTVKMVLASSLSLDGSKDDGRGWRDVGRNAEPTLADMFEYVCHGKCYKFEDGADGQTIKTYVSFGGLLLSLTGPYKKLTPLRVDNVYLLMSRS